MKPNTPGILKLIEMKEFNRRADVYGYKNRKKYVIPDKVENCEYYDIKMIYNQDFVCLPEIDAEGNETIKKNFNSIAAWFWFPEQNKMRPVRVASCIMEFPTFQRLNINSHISRWLAFNPKDDEEDFKIPRYFKRGGLLIGAAINDIKPSELVDFRSDMRSTGPIYGDEIFNEQGKDVIELYQHFKDDIR